MRRGAFAAGVLLVIASPLFAQVEDVDWERHYDCMLKGSSIVVDGIGDEFAWQLAPEVGEFTFKTLSTPLPVRYRRTLLGIAHSHLVFIRDRNHPIQKIGDPPYLLFRQF